MLFDLLSFEFQIQKMKLEKVMALANVVSSRSQRRLPGEMGIWFFILADSIIFTLYFAYLLMYRSDNVNEYVESQSQMSQLYGVLNTIVLLSSSWFVAMAVRFARDGRIQYAKRFIKLAIICGVVFGVIKIFEWGGKFIAGINVSTNDFFMYYFFYTGAHFVHLIIAVVLLGVVLATISEKTVDNGQQRSIEVVASFWHLVDLLWIVLFALFYLVR